MYPTTVALIDDDTIVNGGAVRNLTNFVNGVGKAVVSVMSTTADVTAGSPVSLGNVTLGSFSTVTLRIRNQGTLPLTQAVTYLAMAPKSNAALTTYAKARDAVTKHGPLPVPMHLRNAPTKLMKSLGYGSGYQYPHDSGKY